MLRLIVVTLRWRRRGPMQRKREGELVNVERVREDKGGAEVFSTVLGSWSFPYSFLFLLLFVSVIYHRWWASRRCGVWAWHQVSL
jgi:hypothetical protein